MQKRSYFIPYLCILLFISCIGCLLTYIYSKSSLIWKSVLCLAIFLVLITTICLVSYRKEKRLRSFLSQAHLSQIDWMTQEEFDQFTAELYRQLDYQVTITKGDAYTHSDIIALSRKDSVVLKTNLSITKLDKTMIQEAHEAKAFYGTSRAAVITNNYFHKSTIELALKLGVELIDRDKLNRLLKKVKAHHKH